MTADDVEYLAALSARAGGMLSSLCSKWNAVLRAKQFSHKGITLALVAGQACLEEYRVHPCLSFNERHVAKDIGEVIHALVSLVEVLGVV